MAHASPEDPDNAWRRLNDRLTQEKFSRTSLKAPDYGGPFLPEGPCKTSEALVALGAMMECSPNTARTHLRRLQAIGIAKPHGDGYQFDMEEEWRLWEFIRLFYMDQYGRYQFGERGRVAEDELLAAASLWARIPDGTEFDVLDRYPSELRPATIQKRIMTLRCMVLGLGAWRNERGYYQPPADVHGAATTVYPRKHLRTACRTAIEDLVRRKRLNSSMVERSPAAMEDAFTLGEAIGFFRLQRTGRDKPRVTHVEVVWENLYDAMNVGFYTRVICCEWMEQNIDDWLEGRIPAPQMWAHFLSFIRHDEQHPEPEPVEWDPDGDGFLLEDVLPAADRPSS